MVAPATPGPHLSGLTWGDLLRDSRTPDHMASLEDCCVHPQSLQVCRLGAHRAAPHLIPVGLSSSHLWECHSFCFLHKFLLRYLLRCLMTATVSTFQLKVIFPPTRPRCLCKFILLPACPGLPGMRTSSGWGASLLPPHQPREAAQEPTS